MVTEYDARGGRSAVHEAGWTAPPVPPPSSPAAPPTSPPPGRPWLEAGPPPGGPRKGLPVWALVLLVAGGVFLVACVGLSILGAAIGAGQDEPAPTPSAEPAGQASGAAEDGPQRAEQPAAGTRENPLEPGQTFQVEDWEIELGVTRSGDETVQRVLDENMFNEPPPDGQTLAMVEVSVTYLGEDSATPWTDLAVKLVTPDGAVIDDFMACGVIPSPLTDVDEVLAGGSASGNVCAPAPAGSLEGALWIVEPIFSFTDSERVYVEAG